MADIPAGGTSIVTRWGVRIAGVSAALVVVGVLTLALFPWGTLRTIVASRLSSSLGRPVTIGRIVRTDRFSLHPVIDIQDVAIPQASWAGKGDLARVGHARIRFAALPLLIGRFRPEEVTVDGMRLTFVRDANGRKSWSRGTESREEGSDRPAIRNLVIVNSMITYKDAKRDRSATVSLAANARDGVVVSGSGLIHGAAVRIQARGNAIAGDGRTRPWPFKVTIEGRSVGMTMAGTMDRPLDIGHFTAEATAHGDDLARVDAIIEAGLPGTQPVRLKAQVRRTSPDWEITGLSGTIGRSDIAGHAKIVKREGRTRIEGVVHARRFDFRDLASDRGIQLAAAKRQRFGDRVVPDTAIDLTSVGTTDGRLELSVDQLLWPGSSPFRHLNGRLTVDHSLLTLDRLTLGLTRGRLVGTIVVDQRKGSPRLRLDLAVRDAKLLDFFPNAMIDGSLHGQIRLSGEGKTIRSAIGRSNGFVALVAKNGAIPARTASLLGQDIGRGLTSGKEDRATLRCMITRLDVAKGVGRANPIVIDTSRAFTRATGTVDLSTERLALVLRGAPKQKSVLRLIGDVPIGGTIKAPDIQVPRDAASFKGVMKMLGRAIGGKQGAIAPDADCAALERKALS